MGEPMATQLVAHGFDVVACDRDPERVRLAAEHGATAAFDLAQAVVAGRVVSICVRDEDQISQLIDGGISDGLNHGTILLVHSTIGPRAIRAIAAQLAPRGATVLDAPVSGMRMAAAAGKLTFFIGGAVDALEVVRPGLEAMGDTILHVGGLGAGQVVKLANNLIAFGTAGLLDEVVRVAAAAGVDPDRVVQALHHGSARSWAVENWDFLSRGWTESQPGGAAAVGAITRKDLELAAATAAELDINAPFAALAAQAVPHALTRRAGERTAGRRP
jgi:3-hydroxyisobutyrate dehydrogenase-like beta-hydroxyacid dehydrogenase